MFTSDLSSGASNYQTAWSKALERLSSLSPEQQKYFDLLQPEEQDLLRKGVSPDEILQILQQTGGSKHSLLTKFTDKFAKPFSQFQGVFEVTASTCSGIGAPLVMSAAADFERIEGFLSDMLGKLEMFRAVEAHFKPSPSQSWDHLYDALTNFYVDVIDFTLLAAKYYRNNTFMYVMRRVIRTFDSDFGGVISNMKLHLDSIGPAVQLAAIKQSKEHFEALSFQAKAEADLNAANRLEERKIAVQVWLSGTGMDADQQKHQSHQLPGTCKWFFENQQFSDWFTSKCSSRLCVLGIPGSGKSILSSSLVHCLKSQLPQEEPVLYFFCKKKDENRDNPSSILRTIMLQLLGHSVHGPDFVDILHHARSNGIAVRDYSVQNLWNLLEEMLQILPGVYLVIDGLDECDKKDELADLLEKLTNFSTSTTTVVKIFATCRPNEFEIPWPSIDVEEKYVESDINAYIVSRIEKSATLKLPAHSKKVHMAIRQGAGGTFLWARLMLDTLENSTPWQIENVLNDIPDTLSDVYRLMLERVSDLGEKPVERCRKILHWCVAVCRLLTVDELLLALAVSEGVSSHEQYNSGSDQADLRRLLRRECGSLINVLKDNSVQLIHTSLQEYLLREAVVLDRKESSLVSRMFLIDLEKAHMDLARICLQYNQFASFQADADMSKLDEFEKSYPFSRYCISNWIYHVLNSGNSYASLSNDIMKFFSSTQGWRWLQRCQNFDISLGHLLVFQGKLRVWAQLGGESQMDQSDSGVISNFILYLSKRRYEDPNREDEDQGHRTGDAAHDLAKVYYELGRYEEALEWYRRALDGREKVLGKEHLSTLNTMHHMSQVYSDQDRHSEALEWSGRALAGREKALGMDHLLTLDTVHYMGNSYYKRSQYSEALLCFNRALTGKEKALGKEHPSTISTAHNIACVYNGQERHAKALELYWRVLAGNEKTLGKEHPWTLNTVNNMAMAFERQGRYEEALEWYKQAVSGYIKVLGEAHPSTLHSIHKMANAYTALGQYEEALEWYERALTGSEKALGKEHSLTLHVVNGINCTRRRLESFKCDKLISS